jgi:hypothetical protein
LKNLTAARFDDAHEDLFEAIGAVNQQKTVCRDLQTVRNDKAKALRKRLRGLIEELNQNLSPIDARWNAFGFNLPGVIETPEQPTGLMAALIGPGVVALKWNAAARAGYYHVYKKVVGVDAEYVLVGSPADIDFTLEGLPTGAQVEIVVAAINDAGDGPKSAKVTVTTHL